MGKLTRRGSIIGTAALAGALAFSTAAMANVDGDPINIDGDQEVEQAFGPNIWRFADEDRIGTAVQAAERTNNVWGDTVIIANSEVYADALAAGPLADAIDAPVLLNTPGNSVNQQVSDYLSSEENGVSRVILVGGTDVFGNGVVNQLEDGGLTVERASGINRYQTAVELAGQALDEGEYEDNPNIFFASGEDFPDALSAGAAASASNGIVLLTKGDAGLDAYTFAAVTGTVPSYDGPDLDIHESLITVGGPAAAGTAEGWNGTPVEADFNHVGDDRYDTAVEVAEEYVGDAANFVVTSGQNFPDAVVGGAYAANVDGALLLTREEALTNASADYLESIRLDVENVFVFGGPDSVAPAVSDQINELDWSY